MDSFCGYETVDSDQLAYLELHFFLLAGPDSTLFYTGVYEECCGSVVDCLTQDRGVASSSFTRGTALCPWARHFILCLALAQEDQSRHDWKIVDWDIKNQIKKKKNSGLEFWKKLCPQCGNKVNTVCNKFIFFSTRNKKQSI